MVPFIKKIESDGSVTLYTDEEVRALEGIYEKCVAADKAHSQYDHQFLFPLRHRLIYAQDMLTDARERAGPDFHWISSSEDEPGDFWKDCHI